MSRAGTGGDSRSATAGLVLGDLLGRRRVFIVGAVTFAGASAVGGLSPVFGMPLVARVLQGCGGALMLPTSVAIVSAAFAPRERGRALGTMGGAASVAGALRPTIGGALTSLSWRAVLLVNTPLRARGIALGGPGCAAMRAAIALIVNERAARRCWTSDCCHDIATTWARRSARDSRAWRRWGSA